MSKEDDKVELATLKETVKIVLKRLDKLESLGGEIHRLATSTELLAQTVSNQQKDIDKINNNLEEINKKPSKFIDGMKTSAIGAIIGILVGALFGTIIK